MLVVSRLLAQAREIYQELHVSDLFNESSFYDAFIKDLKHCKADLVIESPFITNKRLATLLPTLEKLNAKKVNVIINTRDPIETDDEYQRNEAYRAVSRLQHLGIRVLYTMSEITNGEYRF